jgi:hypothetical protein
MTSVGMPREIEAALQRFCGGVVDQKQLPVCERQGLRLQRRKNAREIVGPRVM